MPWHQVGDGECVSSIAFEAGLMPDTVWLHSDNADLRFKRTPDTRMKGDRLFVPRSPIMLEAPKVRSEGSFHSFTGRTPGSYIWKYVRKIKQKCVKARSDALHPDVLADTESKMNHLRFTGSEIKDARSNFGDEMLTPGPPPGMTSGGKWIPIFSLEKKRGKKRSISVFPGDKKFDGMWRKIRLKKDEMP